MLMTNSRSLTRVTAVTLRATSSGESTAFQPASSSCSERSPAKSADESPGSTPTPAAHVSSVSVMRRCSPPWQHNTSSVGCSTRRPLTLARPLIGKMTKDGARTTCAELTAIGGTTTSIVSGSFTSYEAN